MNTMRNAGRPWEIEANPSAYTPAARTRTLETLRGMTRQLAVSGQVRAAEKMAARADELEEKIG